MTSALSSPWSSPKRSSSSAPGFLTVRIVYDISRKTICFKVEIQVNKSSVNPPKPLDFATAKKIFPASIGSRNKTKSQKRHD
ncbi:hypothetical protein ACFX11_022927 [Malus domestica]